MRAYAGFFFDPLFAPDYSSFSRYDRADADAILAGYGALYDEADDSDTWFLKIKDLSEKLGFARETKLYKEDPSRYKGHVGDVSGVLRVAVTGREASPDLYSVMRILGKERVLARLEAARGALR